MHTRISHTLKCQVHGLEQRRHKRIVSGFSTYLIVDEYCVRKQPMTKQNVLTLQWTHETVMERRALVWVQQGFTDHAGQKKGKQGKGNDLEG